MMKTPFIWQPAEHMAVSGQTGQGKSTMVSWLLTNCRKYYVVLLTKREKLEKRIEYPGAERVTGKEHDMINPGASWKKIKASLENPRLDRLVVKPKYSERYDSLHDAYEHVYRQGGRTVVVDELFAQCELGLAPSIDKLLTEGRGNDISVVACQQRLSRTTRFAIGEAHHVLSAPLEGRDVMVFRDATTDDAAYVASGLNEFEFIWFKRPNRIAVCKLNVPAGVDPAKNIEACSLDWEVIK